MRQCLYESLRKRNKLPRKDRGAVKEERESGMMVDGGNGNRSVCLFGQTEPLNWRAGLSEAPEGEKEEECRFYNTRSNDQPYSVSFTTASLCRSLKYPYDLIFVSLLVLTTYLILLLVPFFSLGN